MIKLKDLETEIILDWGSYKRNGERSGSEKKKLQHKQKLG